MKYRIIHKTTYTYADYVSLCQNEAYLLPRHTPQQHCRYSQLRIAPAPALLKERHDFFGNRASYFSIQAPHKVLTVTAVSELDLDYPDLHALPTHSPPWETVRDQIAADTSTEGLEARGYVLPSPFINPDAALAAYARPSFPPGRPILAALVDLTRRIFKEFTYDPHFTTIVTPLSEVLQHKRGVCQDFAHLAIACVRSLGLAARYVSGYLETLPPPGKEKLRGADASHAWLAVYVPEQGWVDFDPTNNQIPWTQHITTAWGRDYGDVTPLKGIIFGGGEHQLAVSVDVERLSL